MSTHRETITVPGYGSRTLHYNSQIARCLGRFGSGINNCVTPNAGDIWVSQDWITRKTLAHEWGHGEDAQRLGWRYLPWVLWCLVTHGYAGSPAERRADDYMNAHYQAFAPVGQVPPWVQDA